MRFSDILNKLCRERSGATSTEYALLIALIAFLSVAAWMGIGDSLKKIFEHIITYL